jgi:predicted AAA+ superfamily ATPase
MINRLLEDIISEKVFKGKVIIVTGPGQSGKTTLLRKICSTFASHSCQWFNADEPDIRSLLSNKTSTELKNLIGNYKLVVIDEAQRIENIGITLKLIYDNYPDIQLIASGSSSFELANQINEPLTGKKWEFFLFPLSFKELAGHFGQIEENQLLEDRLVYGSYPDVVNHPDEKRDILVQLSDSYLYKDILTWENLKKPMKLESLLRALAFQVGSEVSYNELGNSCGLNSQTVERYVNLLEKAFIIFKLGALSRNLRNESQKRA